ncbi:hypothetical protein [Spirillospora sp. NPDC048819]
MKGDAKSDAGSDLAVSGGGLLMMRLLVQDWGVRTLAGGGKVTWARLGE